MNKPIQVPTLFRPLFRGENLLWTVLLVSFNSFDYLLTWKLVGQEQAYEANPVAAAILKGFGWGGLFTFKALSLGVVLTVGGIIARRHLVATRRLLRFACAILLLVVGYSVFLLNGTAQAGRAVQEQEERMAGVYGRQVQFRKYLGKVDELAAAVLARKLPIQQAARELHLFVLDLDHDPFVYLRTYDVPLPPEGLLASHVLRQIGFLTGDNFAAARRRFARLGADFRRHYGEMPFMVEAAFAKETDIGAPPPKVCPKSKHHRRANHHRRSQRFASRRLAPDVARAGINKNL